MRSIQNIPVEPIPNIVEGQPANPKQWQTEIIRIPPNGAFAGFQLPAGKIGNVIVRGAFKQTDNDGKLFEIRSKDWVRFYQAEQLCVLPFDEMAAVPFVRLNFDFDPGPTVDVCLLT